tara:strand:- start:49 stop:243 length:195 start_codon:yes stop_codon:yes gene_type:complete
MSKEAWVESQEEDRYEDAKQGLTSDAALLDADPQFQKQLDDEEHEWAEVMEADLLKMIKGSKDG